MHGLIVHNKTNNIHLENKSEHFNLPTLICNIYHQYIPVTLHQHLFSVTSTDKGKSN